MDLLHSVFPRSSRAVKTIGLILRSQGENFGVGLNF